MQWRTSFVLHTGCGALRGLNIELKFNFKNSNLWAIIVKVVVKLKFNYPGRFEV